MMNETQLECLWTSRHSKEWFCGVRMVTLLECSSKKTSYICTNTKSIPKKFSGQSPGPNKKENALKQAANLLCCCCIMLVIYYQLQLEEKLSVAIDRLTRPTFNKAKQKHGSFQHICISQCETKILASVYNPKVDCRAPFKYKRVQKTMQKGRYINGVYFYNLTYKQKI